MKRTTILMGAALAATVVAAAAIADGGAETMRRHMQFMRSGVPAPYGGETNPFKGSADAIAKGRRLYDDNCALCHGADGAGQGPGAKDLKAPPADLGRLMAMPPMKDDYVLWAIAEGGAPFGSPMPAFKDALSADDRWRVIAFLRAGLPR